MMIEIRELRKFIPRDIGMKPSAKSAIVKLAANHRLKSDPGFPCLDSVGILSIPTLSRVTSEHEFGG